MPTTGELIEKFLNTNQGRALLAKHSMLENGIWEVRGEDPNCDFGGHHYQPMLGWFRGNLQDVITHAVTLPDFWSWGGGGGITEVVPKATLDYSLYENAMNDPAFLEVKQAKLEIEQTRRDLEAQIAALEAKRNALPRV